MKLQIVPMPIKEANRFIKRYHRHHEPVQGAFFAIGAEADGVVCGVVVVGHPVARLRDDGWTAEVTRLCTDGTPNACSMLYSAAARAAFAMGYRRIGTYILSSETGVSLKASGWKCIGETGGGSWKRSNQPKRSSSGKSEHPLMLKKYWELTKNYTEGLAPRQRIPERAPMPKEQEVLAL